MGRIVVGQTPRQVPASRSRTQAEIGAQYRADNAGDRKFIRERMGQAIVLKRIGEPDSKSFVGNLECWYYSATRLDPQTNTRVCFEVSGYVFDVERLIAR